MALGGSLGGPLRDGYVTLKNRAFWQLKGGFNGHDWDISTRASNPTNGLLGAQ
jgi:hypothetical protein